MLNELALVRCSLEEDTRGGVPPNGEQWFLENNNKRTGAEIQEQLW